MRPNLAITALLLLAAVVSANMTLPSVKAQSTDITDVSYPKHVMFDLERRTTEPPLLVTAAVSYSNAKPGYFLLAAIFDLDSGDVAKGSASTAPGTCTSVGTSATCLIISKSSSGVEFVEFLLAGFSPTMSLAIVAVLLNETGSLFYNSESDYEFAITMTASLELVIRIPLAVSVSVDGVRQAGGNVRLNLVPGLHEISVPNSTELDNVTRLRFEHWVDGINETKRVIRLNHGTTLSAVYVTQFLFSAKSLEGNVAGSGWYDEGSNANFSVPSTVPMNGILGLLGGDWKFQGWYENGELLASSGSGSTIMRQPHTIIAKWEPDYSLPSFVITVASSLGIVVYLRRNS